MRKFATIARTVILTVLVYGVVAGLWIGAGYGVYLLLGRIDGNRVAHTSPRAKFCETHECIGDWENANGTRVQCADGAWSFSGGISGACSHHGGHSDAFGASGGF